MASQLDTRWNTNRHATATLLFNPTLISYYSLTPKWSVFAEYGGFYPISHGQSRASTQFVQGGLLYLPTPRQQWDIRVTRGLNNQSADWALGFGYSVRLGR